LGAIGSGLTLVGADMGGGALNAVKAIRMVGRRRARLRSPSTFKGLLFAHDDCKGTENDTSDFA
jgi:hypothetical protein